MTERANRAANAVGGRVATRGEAAERFVVERLREALPPSVAVLSHVRG